MSRPPGDPERGTPLYLLAMLACGAWLAFLLWHGGFVIWWLGIRISSRDASRPAIALGVLAAFYIWKRRAAYPADAEALINFLHHRARWLVLAIALTIYLMAAMLGTWSASGSDPSGYVSQSAKWLDGTVVRQEPLLAAWRWPHRGRALAPLGYTVNPDGTAIVPIYAPGLPMIMAVSRLIAGECGPFLVVPVFAAVAIIATYLLGAAAGSRILGLIAALWLACSPAFLYLSMVPMSDVPVAAVWTMCLVLILRTGTRARLLAGIAAGIAILIRPNLAPVLPLLAIGVMLIERAGSSWKTGLRHAIIFSLGALPAVAVAAAMQHLFYGAPWRSGYGTADTLFALQNIIPNAARYFSDLVRTQSPLILAAVATLAGFGIARSTAAERAARIGVALFIGGVWACYLPYFQFEEWWYLRFLLPTFPILIVLALLPLRHLVLRLRPAVALPLALSGAFALIAYEVAAAGSRMDLDPGSEVRYASVARYVDEHLPANAAIVSMQHSGSVRYYARRLTVRYDLLDGQDLPKAIAVLEQRGYRAYLLLEDWEEPDFRRRFQGTPLGGLEFGIVATYPYDGAVNLYNLGPPGTGTWDLIPQVTPARCGLLGFSASPSPRR